MKQQPPAAERAAEGAKRLSTEKARERAEAALANVRKGYDHPPRSGEVGQVSPANSPVESRDQEAGGPSGQP